MLNDYRNLLISVTSEMTEKEQNKYKINHLLNLSDKLGDQRDQDIESILLELKDLLSHCQEGKIDKRVYNKLYQKLATIVKERFDLHEKGSMSGQYIGLGLCFGTAIGTALSSMFTGNISIGIGIGMALGAGLGAQKEKQLEKEGKLY